MATTKSRTSKPHTSGTSKSNGSGASRAVKPHVSPSASSAPDVAKAAGLGVEIQPFETLVDRPIKLEEDDRKKSVAALNGVLANTQILYALYKKHHWLMRGPTFYQLHLLLDKQADEQLELADQMAERIQKIGGIAIGDPRHVAELTDIPRPPNGAESVPAMLQRLLDAHESTLARVRAAIEETEDGDDEGTNDLLVSSVLRTNETHVWYVQEHLVPSPLTFRSDAGMDPSVTGGGKGTEAPAEGDADLSEAEEDEIDETTGTRPGGTDA